MHKKSRVVVLTNAARVTRKKVRKRFLFCPYSLARGGTITRLGRLAPP